MLASGAPSGHPPNPVAEQPPSMDAEAEALAEAHRTALLALINSQDNVRTKKALTENFHKLLEAELTDAETLGLTTLEELDRIAGIKLGPAKHIKKAFPDAGPDAVASQPQAPAAVTDKPMVITFQKVKAEPKGDKPEAKASKDTKATFDTTPSWSDLCLRVERIFPDMAAEAYSLQCNGMDLSENLWPRAVLPSKPPAGPLQVSLMVIGKCKAFSSFKREDTWQLLHTKMQQVPEREECFPKDDDVPGAALDEELQSVLPIKTQADIIAFVGQELALRCCKTDPRKHSKEVSKRQMISPVIYTAAALAGKGVSVDEERSVCGAYGKGSIDFIIEFDGFDIVVLEGKLHETLDEHLGQLAAEMRSAREQYTRTHLGKRKFDDEGEFEQVPSFGILSNGTTYNFYKYMAQERSLVQFTERANLDKGITAGAAGKAVLPILLRLVKVIKEQMEGMRRFKKAKHGGS